MSRGTGRLAFAIALISGVGSAIAAVAEQGLKVSQAAILGHRMHYEMKNHYRGINGGSRSGAAAQKRAARTRRNIRARSKK